MKNLIIILFTALIALSSNAQSTDFTKYVDPFIGTGGHGHTFPGATLPFGMVQLSPDTDTEGWDWSSGYHYSDSSIMGFSHTHISGTGVGDLGDILLMPRTGKLILNRGTKKDKSNSYRSAFSHDNEKAIPGLYSVLLDDVNVKAELTATQHCGFHRYIFPKSDSSYIIIDPSSSVGRNSNPWMMLKIENDSTISGYKLSFGWVPFQYVYFVAKFSKPFNSYQLARDTRKPGWKEKELETNWVIGSVHFSTKDNDTIHVKVGISAVSIENARQNLASEVTNWDFNGVANNANKVWNNELSKVSISAPADKMKIFYTGLYHALIQPNNIADINGDYRGVDYQIANAPNKAYYSTFSLWDTYRAAHPMYSILYPSKNIDFIKSMLTHHSKQGFLPIWTLWGAENYCMIGNHAIPVLTDAFFKGLLSAEQMQAAYKAAKETSLNDHRGSDWTLYNKIGYFPIDMQLKESVSKTLEVAYNDWCVAMMAKKLGYTNDYTFFLNRSQNYRNLHDSTSGFFRARDSQGQWMPNFSPLNIMHNHGYTEANAWQYYWYVPQDIPNLIKLTGGQKKFETKLDSLFSMSSKVEGSLFDVTGFMGQYVHGNEPSHHVAYLYAWTKAPWKTQELIHRIAKEMYSTNKDGYAGNEDCGQMSSWYILSALGFYPVNPANGIYVIGSPLVQTATLNLENGNTFYIEVKNVAPQNVYIKSISLNGKPLNQLYIKHADITTGGKLIFEMTAKPNLNLIKMNPPESSAW